MSESELSGPGQEPGADVGDDGDVPDDPLLGGGTAGDPTESDVGGVGLGESGES